MNCEAAFNFCAAELEGPFITLGAQNEPLYASHRLNWSFKGLNVYDVSMRCDGLGCYNENRCVRQRHYILLTNFLLDVAG